MKNITILLIVLALMALTGCTGNFVKDEEVFKIGFSGALTGPNAALGVNNQRGVQMAVDKLNSEDGINGLPVEIVYLDDQFEGKQTIINFQKFVDIDKVDVVLTTTYGGSMSVAEFADQIEMVVVNTIDTSEELASLGEYNFAVGIYDESIGYAIAEFIPTNSKVGVMFSNSDPFATFVKDSFVEKFNELGGNVLKTETYDSFEVDFKTQLMKLQDMDYVALISFDEGGLVVKQAKELGIEAEFVGIDTVSSENFMKNSQGTAEGMYFTFWEATETEKVERFLVDYQTKYGETPEQMLFTATGYDSVMLIAEAAKSDEPLKDAMYEIRDFEGLSGRLTMDPDGIVRSVKETMFVRTKDSYYPLI